MSSKSCKSRKKPQEQQPQVNPAFDRIPAYIPQVIDQKLRNDPLYAACSDEELSRLARDLTKWDKMAEAFFVTNEDDSPPASPCASLLEKCNPCPPHKGGGEIKVKVILKNPTWRRAVGNALSQGGVAETVEFLIEDEFVESLTVASLQLGDQILKWGRQSLVIPHGTPLQETFPPGQLHAACDDEEDERVCRLGHCSADKFEKCLKIVTRYNKVYYYDELSRNSHHFVRDALEALGMKKQILPQLLTQYKEYLEALKKERSEGVPVIFQDHKSLNHYVHTHFARVKNKPKDIELLLNHFIKFHYEEKRRAPEPVRWVCPLKNCLMDSIISFLDPEKLLLRRYRHK